MDAPLSDSTSFMPYDLTTDYYIFLHILTPHNSVACYRTSDIPVDKTSIPDYQLYTKSKFSRSVKSKKAWALYASVS